MNKKLEIVGFLSIILISGITVQDAFADIVFTGIVDLLCEGDTELAYVDTIDFLVMCPLFGASPPVITLIGDPAEELILGFTHIDDGATASDTGDGDLTNNIAVGGLPVDTSTIGTFFVTFDVTDSAGNDALQVVRSVTTTKRSPTDSGGTALSAPPVGGVTTVPTISTIPPLPLVPSEPIQPPPRRTIDEVFDLFSFLFEERILPTAERIVEEVEPLVEPLIPTLEPTPTLEFVPEPESVTDIPAPLFEPTPTEEIRPNFIESIQSFFARLFG